MLEKFEKHIHDSLAFLKEGKLLLAISGGIDSVVLTHLLHALHFDISLAHCNFKLRGIESDTDELFVTALGKQLNLKTHTTPFDTNQFAKKQKHSIQIAARALRYNWFQELVQKHAFDYVLTAHHADDNLETFLINLSRGTGLEGFTGIPVINKHIVRPLLPFSRNEIEHYAQSNGIVWREDQSNKETKYVRNKIRHQITPILKEINPQLISSFQKTLANLQESQHIVNDAVTTLKEKVISTNANGVLKIDVLKMKALSNPKAYLFEILKTYNFSEWNDVTNLLTAQSGKQVVSKTHRLLKDRDFLLLSEIELKQKDKTYTIDQGASEIKIPLHLTFEAVSEIAPKDIQTIYIDTQKIEFPLTVRKWGNGDSFHPVGMLGKKKISKFFKDEKYSLLEKENIWLLCSKEEIVWIIGKRQDRQFLADADALSILKIEAINSF